MEVPLPKVTHLVGLEQGFECKQLPYVGLPFYPLQPPSYSGLPSPRPQGGE